MAAARQLAGDKAQPALELVGYDAELSAAMKYAFGGAFVCKVGGPSGVGSVGVWWEGLRRGGGGQ